MSRARETPQAACVRLWRSVGAYVSVKSENRRARGTRGHPDMLVMHPRFPHPLAQEHKVEGEATSPAQIEFQRAWIASHGLYLRGDINAVYAFLREYGLIAAPVPVSTFQAVG